MIRNVPHSKRDRELYQEPVVDVCEDMVFAPLKSIGMELFGIVCPPNIVLSTRPEEAIRLRMRAPVQRAYHTVSSIRVVVPEVASALHNINLAAARPLSICRIFRHHPNGGPQPRALGHR